MTSLLTRPKQLVFVFSAGLAIFVASLLSAHNASASIWTNSRLNYGNAGVYCSTNNGPSWEQWAKGMVWLSNNEGDYYSESVTVPTNSTSVLVSIRGAVNTCRTSFSGATDMWAIDVSTSYLSGLGGTSFYRGQVPGGTNYAWSSVGSKLYGYLNVNGVAKCDAASLSTGSASETISIAITRRQQQTRGGSVVYTSPDPGTEWVPITVTRTCPRYSYTLTPQITTPASDGVIEADAGARPVAGHVSNSGPTVSQGTEWRLTEIHYPKTTPLASIPNKGGGVSGSDPCTYFTGDNYCSNPALASGTGKVYTTSGANHTATSNIGSYEIGTKICYALSVKPYNASSSSWRHSALRCYVIGKGPKVQVRGNDLMVGRGNNATGNKIISNIATRYTTVTGANAGVYGSWSEYAIIPSGTVTAMGSGAAYANPYPSSPPDICKLSLLTLSNTTQTTQACTGNVGHYLNTSASPAAALKARFTVSSGTAAQSGNVDVKNLAAGKVYGVSGDISLSSSVNVPTGKWVVIRATSNTVTITGNIQYDDFTSKPSDIPQVIILANNIVINSNVTRVDAWLVATGTGVNGYLKTCNITTPATQLNSSVCNAVLTMNGPVIANKLYMYRTAGAEAGAQAGDPAEIFNLRPDAYLWGATFTTNGQASARIQTASTTELPPRL